MAIDRQLGSAQRLRVAAQVASSRAHGSPPHRTPISVATSVARFSICNRDPHATGSASSTPVVRPSMLWALCSRRYVSSPSAPFASAHQRCALALIRVERHAEAARGLHQLDVELHDLACPSGSAPAKWSASRWAYAAVPAGSTRPRPYRRRIRGGSLEGAEHQGQAAVVAQMGRGLVAAAGAIQVDHRIGVEHAQRIEAFWRQVDAPTLSGRRDEEHVLALHERPQRRLDLRILRGHPIPSRCRWRHPSGGERTPAIPASPQLCHNGAKRM